MVSRVSTTEWVGYYRITFWLETLVPQQKFKKTDTILYRAFIFYTFWLNKIESISIMENIFDEQQ